MSGKRMCQSYEIIDSRRVGNTEVVLGYNPTEVSPYVTWKYYAYIMIIFNSIIQYLKSEMKVIYFS